MNSLLSRKEEQHKELSEYLAALNEKIEVSRTFGNGDITRVLTDIRDDIKKWIGNFEADPSRFSDIHEEVVSLYVFTEIYLRPASTGTMAG